MRDITLADTFYQLFTTRAFASGVPTALAGTPVVSAYENESLTQITAGITLGVDHDGVAGLNLLTVVASGANGYEAGKDYALVITTGTVGGVSVVGEVVAEFTIGRSAAAVDLANGTDGLGAIKAVDDAILVDTGTTLDGRIPAALTANGNMKSSMVEILTTALTETAGLLAGGFKKFFNVAAPTGTANSLPDAVAGATGGVFIAGTNAATTVTTALTTTFTGNLTGSVATATNVTTVNGLAANVITAASMAADAGAEIADAVWDEAVAGHVAAGSFGATDAAILADTNELQVDWVNGGRLDLILDIIAADTTTDIPATISTLQTAVNTIDDFLDSEIADILTDTSTTIDDLVDDLEARLTAALATQLTAHSLAVLRGVVDVGSTTTAVVIELINGGAPSATDDFYNGRHIVFTSGALLGQATSISDYTGATKTATVPALTAAPADDVTFVIV